MPMEYKLHIGCHLSSAKGFLAMGREASRLDADTFAFFTRNPRGGRAKELDLADVEAFLQYKEDEGIVTLVAHAPYTMNACAAKENLRRFAHEAMADDLQRLEHLPGNLYNFHPGNHVGQGAEKGIELIAQQLNDVLTPDQQTTVLLETMAGKGTEVGRTFEELRAIIDRVIGLPRLKAIHLNDSQNERGSHKDRHARIGEGHIGLDALVRVVRHPALKDLPFILETPNDAAGYAREIALLREKAAQ